MNPSRTLLLVTCLLCPPGAWPVAAEVEEPVGQFSLPRLYWADVSRDGRAFSKDPPVIALRGRYLLYYSMPLFYAGGYNNDPQQIGVATSRDGISWTCLSDRPLLPNGAPGEWNASESGHPGIFNDTDGRTYLFFQGNNDHGRTWHLSAVEIGWNEHGPFVDRQSRRFPLPAGSRVESGGPPSTPEDPFPVTIRVDAATPRGELKPIWRFFGADEPNYAYMTHGRKLLAELGALAPKNLFFRAQNLLTSGEGKPARKRGSTGAYGEDAAGQTVYRWVLLDRIFDTFHRRVGS
jgi:hypothetical protein